MPVGRKLEGPPFAGVRQKTALPPEDRYALAVIREGRGAGEYACQAVLRDVIQAGLASLGWTEVRRFEEYNKYKARCLKTGAANEFEGR